VISLRKILTVAASVAVIGAFAPGTVSAAEIDFIESPVPGGATTVGLAGLLQNPDVILGVPELTNPEPGSVLLGTSIPGAFATTSPDGGDFLAEYVAAPGPSAEISAELEILYQVSGGVAEFEAGFGPVNPPGVLGLVPPGLPYLVQQPGVLQDVGGGFFSVSTFASAALPEGLTIKVLSYDFVPEPASFALLGAALVAIGLVRRRPS